jgi:type IV secretion system protein VirB4
VLETTSATPRYINFHQGDLGHFTVIGPSGSGKTVVLNFLTAQAQKVAPRTVFFDKDRGAEIFLRAMGAHYTRLVPGQSTGFNPLSLPDTPGNRAFLHDFLACLLAAGDPGELATIADAVETLYDHAPPLRRLSHLGELLAGHHRPRPGDLASRLAPWVGAARKVGCSTMRRTGSTSTSACWGSISLLCSTHPPAHPCSDVSVPPHRGAAGRIAHHDPRR